MEQCTIMKMNHLLDNMNESHKYNNEQKKPVPKSTYYMLPSK